MIASFPVAYLPELPEPLDLLGWAGQLGHEGIGRVAVGVAGDVLADNDFHAFAEVFAADLGHRAVGGDDPDRDRPDEIAVDDPQAAGLMMFLVGLGLLRRNGAARRLASAARLALRPPACCRCGGLGPWRLRRLPSCRAFFSVRAFQSSRLQAGGGARGGRQLGIRLRLLGILSTGH